ncbi:hypothetical protein [Oscillatoria nigro-viridis]|nr:hypothetical protein [Oscillatoria nigro-viridis]
MSFTSDVWDANLYQVRLVDRKISAGAGLLELWRFLIDNGEPSPDRNNG